MKFYEDRINLKLLSQGLLPKFDYVRAKISISVSNNHEAINDATDAIIEYESNDDDNQNDPGQPTTITTSSHSNEQNARSEKSLIKGNSIRGHLNHAREIPHNSPTNNINEGIPPSIITKVLETSKATDKTSDERRINEISALRNVRPLTSGAPIMVPPSTPTARGSTRQSVQPTAAFIKPQRDRKAPTRNEFDKSFGPRKRKDQAHLTHQKTEPLTYEKTVNRPNARE